MIEAEDLNAEPEVEPAPKRFPDAIATFDYAQLRLRAVVDYLKLEVELTSPSQGWWLRKLIGETYVEGIDEVPGRAASRFLVRIDDPLSWHAVRESIRALDREVVSAPSLAEIEVSLDAYLPESQSDLLPKLTERMFRFACYVCSDNRRLARRKGETISAELSAMQLASKLDQGFMVVVGSMSDPESQRFYTKRTDQSGKVELPVSDHRARMEVALRGSALPFFDLADAEAFRFESMSKKFSLRTVKDSIGTAPPLSRLVWLWPVVQGARTAAARRKYRSHTRADLVFNARAYGALRELTRRMRSVPKHLV
jgi:hypothetical protein